MQVLGRDLRAVHVLSAQEHSRGSAGAAGQADSGPGEAGPEMGHLQACLSRLHTGAVLPLCDSSPGTGMCSLERQAVKSQGLYQTVKQEQNLFARSSTIATYDQPRAFVRFRGLGCVHKLSCRSASPAATKKTALQKVLSRCCPA